MRTHDQGDANPPAPYVVLVEGESDCHALWLHDLPALGLPGATNWRDGRDLHLLDGSSASTS